MGSVTVQVSALQAGVTNLQTLADNVENARTRIQAAIPHGMSLTGLTSTGGAGTFSAWAEEQITSPLSVVLDTARLLETDSNAPVTITFPGEYSITAMTENLGTLLTDRLESAESEEDLNTYLTMLGTYRDVPAIQETLTEGLGETGVADLLTRVGEAGIAMTVVHDAFSADSQDTIAGWVSDDIADPDSIDTNTAILLNGFSRSEDFSTSLYETVTPDQMTDAIQHLNAEAYETVDWDGPIEDAATLYSQFINGAGTAFATYTNAVDDPEALADTWVAAITDDDKPGNASALTFLIRKGGENAAFDPDFLYNVTEDVYQWERDHEGRVWGPRDEGTRLYDPDLARNAQDYVDIREAAVRSDGLANLLGSMEHTPEAAQRFFANGYEGEGTEGENSRIEYLMLERNFGSDPDSGLYSDNGYGLGVALEAAAAGDRSGGWVPGLGPSDEWSAGFATDLFEFVAKHEEEKTGDSGWQPNVLGDDRYHGYPGTSVALGNIGAAYADDVYELLDNENYPASTDPASLQIDYDTLEKVIGQIGYHDDMSGLETLSAGLMAEGNERFRGLLDELPEPHSLDQLEGLDPQGILDSNGEVLGKALDLGLASKAEGEELEQQRAEFAAKAFDMATSFVPGAGDVFAGVKDTLWETAIDLGKDEGLEALKGAVTSAPDATSGQYADIQNAQFEDLIRYNTYDQLLSTGYLDEYIGDGMIPESMIVGEGENRRFREDIRFDGVDGLPEDISDSERREIVEGYQYLLTNNREDGELRGPGASLGGLMTDALNGYDRVKPPGEDG